MAKKIEEQNDTPDAGPVYYFDIPSAEPDEDGFVGSSRWLKIPCAHPSLQPRPGYQGLWAELDLSLTIEEAEAIPVAGEASYEEIYPHVCPRVRSWNVKALNHLTGKMEPVPPPVEIGPDAFRVVDALVLMWISNTLRGLHLYGGPNRKNETKQSPAGRDGANDVA